MLITSSTQLRSTAVKSILENVGSRGNSAIFRPKRDNSPSSSNAPNAYKFSSAVIKDYKGGGSIKSKLIKSLIPIAFNNNTVLDRFVLCISGTVTGSISCLQACSVYSR